MPPPADTFGKYVQLRHEILRAEFFGTVPNYEANLAIERARMEADNPTYATNPGLDAQLDAWHNANKYGAKLGSPNKEL